MNYFLKSHGGAHAIQCLCSALASLAGMAALVVKPTSPMRITLLQRTMLFAMMKHVSGLLASSVVAAKAIPEANVQNVRSVSFS